MTGRVHAAAGMVATAYACNIDMFNHSDKVYIIFGIMTGSVLLDIDTKNSFISNMFPPVAWFIGLFTKHRGVIHYVLPFLLIVLYFFRGYDLFLFGGIGGCAHIAVDLFGKITGITCKDEKGNTFIYISLWLWFVGIIGCNLWNEYHLIKYVPKDALAYIKSYESLLVLNK